MIYGTLCKAKQPTIHQQFPVTCTSSVVFRFFSARPDAIHPLYFGLSIFKDFCHLRTTGKGVLNTWTDQNLSATFSRPSNPSTFTRLEVRKLWEQLEPKNAAHEKTKTGWLFRRANGRRVLGISRCSFRYSLSLSLAVCVCVGLQLTAAGQQATNQPLTGQHRGRGWNRKSWRGDDERKGAEEGRRKERSKRKRRKIESKKKKKKKTKKKWTSSDVKSSGKSIFSSKNKFGACIISSSPLLRSLSWPFIWLENPSKIKRSFARATL